MNIGYGRSLFQCTNNKLNYISVGMKMNHQEQPLNGNFNEKNQVAGPENNG